MECLCVWGISLYKRGLKALGKKWDWHDGVYGEVTRREASHLIYNHIHMVLTCWGNEDYQGAADYLKKASFWLEKMVSGTDLK